MRISIEENDHGYREDVQHFLIFLDKKLLKLCTMADEEQGVATVVKTEQNGQRVVTDENDEIVTETLHGDVVITTQKSGKILNKLWNNDGEI